MNIIHSVTDHSLEMSLVGDGDREHVNANKSSNQIKNVDLHEQALDQADAVQTVHVPNVDSSIQVHAEVHKPSKKISQKPIGEMLKELKFVKTCKASKRIHKNKLTENELLYIKTEMAQTKQTE